jgi:tight adherence protein B
MSSLIIYGLPAVAFLLVGGLAVVIVSLWSKKFGASSKALSRRLEEASAVRYSDSQDRLARSMAPAATGVMGWLMRNLPGVARLRGLLIRSGSDKTAEEVVGLCLLLVFAAGGLAFLILPVGFLVAGLIGLMSGAIPVFYFLRKETIRRKKFDEQLPEALDFLSRALRAGHGLSIAIGMVGDELPDPIGQEFKTTYDELNFGLAFNDALSNLTSRVSSSDLNFFVVAVLIQRETGGNLAELLGVLSNTVRDRLKLMGKVEVLASEGKLSGVLISAMPFVLGLVLSIINPGYTSLLWTTAAGKNVITIGLIMMVIGTLWMRKITQIKV